MAATPPAAAPTVQVPAPSILLVHPSAELYGADRVFLESVSAMVDAGAAVTVALPVDGPLVAELTQRGARVVRTRTAVLQKSALRPAGFVRLIREGVAGLLPSLRLLRTAGRDGVYVSTITIPGWTALARLARRRVTLHVHEAERSAPPLVRRVLSMPAAWAHHVVVNSDFSLDTLTGPDTRTRRRSTVVYNGVPGPADVVPARERLEGPLRLLFIGRLSPRKGPMFALDVLAEVVGRGVDAHLTLLGSVYTGYEWFEAELRTRAAEPELAGRVTFAGFQRDVWPLLAAADVVLIPSLVDEPFGNTAVEAVLGARPVVVSATSGLREAAGGYRSALVTEPGDRTLWGDAVTSLVDGWSGYRVEALRDAAEAESRHAPRRYREQIAAIVLPGATSGRAVADPEGARR